MWRKKGAAKPIFTTRTTSERYGDQIDFPEDFRFPPRETDIRVRMRVTMNDPGKRPSRAGLDQSVGGEERSWSTAPTWNGGTVDSSGSIRSISKPSTVFG